MPEHRDGIRGAGLLPADPIMPASHRAKVQKDGVSYGPHPSVVAALSAQGLPMMCIDQPSALKGAQKVSPLASQHLETPLLVWLDFGDLNNQSRQFGDTRIIRGS